MDAFNKNSPGKKETIGIRVNINETVKYDGRFEAYVLKIEYMKTKHITV